MSFKANYKIKKSKLIYCIPINKNVVSQQGLDFKQKVPSLSFRSQHKQSNNKIETINFTKYNIQRKIQLQKRKQIKNEHLNLFLDGSQAPAQNYQVQKQQNKFQNKIILENKFSIINQNYETINPAKKLMKYDDESTLPAEKNLKNLILKQINLRSQVKNQKIKKANINNLSLQAMEGLCILKKINKITKQKIQQSKIKRQFQMKKLRNISQRNIQSSFMEDSGKFSIFSQRNTNKNKSKRHKHSNFKLNTQRQFQQSTLPSLQLKNKLRPVLTLDESQSNQILSQSYIVYKYSQNKIITGFNYKKNAQIASLTKIMTFYTILNICKTYSVDYKTRVVQICECAQDMSGTSAQLFQGQKYTLKQLFYGLMLPSGNDAAIAIAKEGSKILKQYRNSKISSDEDDIKCFVKHMNQLAKNIKMTFSNFVNPHGLSHPQNVSNPYEICLLVSQCLKFKEFLEVTGTKSYSFTIQQNKYKRQIKWQNTNKLLRREGFIGGKTGVTSTAGPCLASIYKSRDGQIYITVVLRAPKLSRRFKQTRYILGYSLRKLNKKKFQNESNHILKNNGNMDSDNSSQQQSFDFKRSDSKQMKKRQKILIYQM